MTIRKAIFGGSFDPFHKGHLAILQAALKTQKYEQIYLLPVGRPPLKGRKPLPQTFRLDIIRRSVSHLPSVIISEYELERPHEPSYTFDTLMHFREVEPETDWTLIYGSDVLFEIESWHRADKLLKNARFDFVLRDGIAATAAMEKAEELRQNYGAEIDFFSMAPQPFSSTAIREELSAGKGVNKDMGLERRARRLIKQYDLYHFDDAYQAMSHETFCKVSEYERLLTKHMSYARLRHSLSVMLYGLELCRRHSIDPNRFAIAAILHDLAKEWSTKKQKKWARRWEKLPKSKSYLMHGYAAAAYMQQKLGIEDRSILNAVALHTAADRRMDTLGKVLFLADKLEPSRNYPDLKMLQKAAMESFEGGYIETIISLARHLRRMGFVKDAEEQEELARKIVKNHKVNVAYAKLEESKQ